MQMNHDLALKFAKFKEDSRARVSLKIILFAFLISLPAELLCNVRPLLLVLGDKIYCPILFKYSERDFGGKLPSEPDYKSDEFIHLLKDTEDKVSNHHISFHLIK